MAHGRAKLGETTGEYYMYTINFKNGESEDFDSLIAANLRYADLSDADLNGAVLRRADLRSADLSGADLSGADLRGADLRWAIGNMDEIRSMQIDRWNVVFTNEVMAIGCKQYPIEKWRDFTDDEINEMNEHALKWWKKWKDFIFTAIELSYQEKSKA